MIDPKGPAKQGSNTAAAIASTVARTSKKLSISPTSSNVTYYSADEMMLRNTVYGDRQTDRFPYQYQKTDRNGRLQVSKRKVAKSKKSL